MNLENLLAAVSRVFPGATVTLVVIAPSALEPCVPIQGLESFDTLNQMERDILTALGDKHFTARTIASRAGYRCNSHFRTVLAGLVRRGFLSVDQDGYRRIVDTSAEGQAPLPAACCSCGAGDL